jgi:glycosyltransferase involved in cell wall biosynthesis
MKLFLVKIGKVWSVLRRDGIVGGGSRVLGAFFSLFRRVHPGDILFVTNGVGDSARYRCEHVAEELRFRGFRTAITVQDNPFLPSYADQFAVFVFHRVLFTSSVAKFVERIKEQGKEIIFEADDLVYDPAYLIHMDSFATMNPLERKLYENGLGGEILADPYVKVATTTTTFLADKLREKGKQVFIVPNKLSEADVRIVSVIASEARQSSQKKTSWIPEFLQRRTGNPRMTNDKITLAYFSGSASHNKDFATIAEPLLSILGKYPETELFIYGPLDLDARFDAFGDCVKKVPYTSREKHLENVAAADINLAPLEIGNPFCESKSELKFFEAGILGVPTVASATRTFREAIVDGKDGFTAATDAEWTTKLEKLILDPALREEMGEKARAKSFEKYATMNAKNESYYQYLIGKIVKSVPASSPYRVRGRL